MLLNACQQGLPAYIFDVRILTRASSYSSDSTPQRLRRSSHDFSNDRSSCVFPSAIHALRRVHKQKLAALPLFASSPIDYVSIRLYTKKTDPVISSKDQLKGKVVGHLLGSIGTTLLDEKDVTIQLVSDKPLLLKMLFAGRLDVVMGHHPDIPMAIERLGLDDVYYDPIITVYRTPVHIVCHKFKEVDDLLDKINFRIREVRANGMAQKILSKYAEIVPLSEDSSIFKALENPPM
ncbi:MAG: transporter substrate-binding domain-containing protein [Sneathiella sp.]